jgi:hypothetical protein
VSDRLDKSAVEGPGLFIAAENYMVTASTVVKRSSRKASTIQRPMCASPFSAASTFSRRIPVCADPGPPHVFVGSEVVHLSAPSTAISFVDMM